MTAMIELERGTTFAFGGWGHVFVAVWHKAATVETARRVTAAMRQFAKGHADGIDIVIVLEPNSGAPDGETRQIISREMRALTAVTRHVLAVFEGEGFKAAAMRSVLSGMQLLARTPNPTKVFTTVEEGTRWLARQNRDGFAPAELAAAIAGLRQPT